MSESEHQILRDFHSPSLGESFITIHHDFAGAVRVLLYWGRSSPKIARGRRAVGLDAVHVKVPAKLERHISTTKTIPPAE